MWRKLTESCIGNDGAHPAKPNLNTDQILVRVVPLPDYGTRL